MQAGFAMVEAGFTQAKNLENIIMKKLMDFLGCFAGTAATIVSGAMAGRTKFSGYLIYSLIISGFIYSVIGHWIWGRLCRYFISWFICNSKRLLLWWRFT